jgi:hypothetical protein
VEQVGDDADAPALDLGGLGVLLRVDEFFGSVSAISSRASGSIQVVTKEAMLSSGLPSRLSSSWISW